MKKLVIIALITLSTLSACSTVRGMGQDIETLGKGMQKSGS